MTRRGLRIRILLLAMVACVAGGTVTARLVEIQIRRGDAYRKRALAQRQRIHPITPRRGDILDRNGRELAVSVPSEAIAVRPSRVTDPDGAARVLAPILGETVAEVAGRLRSRSPYVYLCRKPTPRQCRKVRAAAIEGVELERWSRRIYPHRTLAAHALGFVRVDHTPLGGAELAFDAAIRGTPGRAIELTDAKGTSFSHRVVEPAVPGNSLSLTIDLTLQHMLEEELDRAVRAARAKAGAAVVVDPTTGEVLAMASRPTFNPNDFASYTSAERSDRAVINAYEPGSTFKVITAAAAVETGKVHADDVIFCGNGSYMVGRHRIRDHRSFGNLTFADVIAYSSNVGAIEAGMRVPPDTFHDFICRFGFGEKTGVGLRGEHPGVVYPTEQWSRLSQPGLAMGQEILATPLQVISAVGAVANDGVLVPPWMARSLISPDGNVITRFTAPVSRRVVGVATAHTLTSMLVGVVDHGTGRAAAAAGYEIAGKTGTAQKSAGGNEGYLPGKYVASFAGYAPARKPRFAAIFVIDEPQVRRYHGGDVAAPAFGRFAARALPAMGVSPAPGTGKTSAARHVAVSSRQASRDRSARWVTARRPAPGLSGSSVSAPDGRMPDLLGLTSREALARVTSLGLSPHVAGAGRVFRQEPSAGAPLTASSEGCQLWLSRP